MKNNNVIYIVIVIVLIILVGGFFWWQGRDDARLITNEEMLDNGNETPVIGNNVSYFNGANGYLVRPEAPGNYPGVVMIHENRGLRPEIISMAEQLAKEGYIVLAVDLLGDVVETQDEARALTEKYDQQRGVENMKAAVDYLKSQGVTKIASLGWCFGGGQSLQFALSGESLDATVIYYGRLATTTQALAPIKWPVLGIFAGEDQSISVESVNQFDRALDSLGVINEIYIYPGVGHAFANPSGMNYAPTETLDAWQKTVVFLEKNLK